MCGKKNYKYFSLNKYLFSKYFSLNYKYLFYSIYHLIINPLDWIWGVNGLLEEESGVWPFGWKPINNNIKKNKYPNNSNELDKKSSITT